ncbi:hypothetical protein ACFXJ8_15160 [Nonomuraea sp. NPDC059194]|uniref:hypothetical protein n=1 Tax=Nonomuraea sp. NPDC059194 TaxID=3346764 RepID=UPI0036A44555
MLVCLGGCRLRDATGGEVVEPGIRCLQSAYLFDEAGEILRDHIDKLGVGEDGRLFRIRTDGMISGSAYAKVWKEARTYAFTPNQVASPLAARPYDLRHAADSLWLNVGVHAPEAAERADHGVDVMLKVYAKCIDGQRDVANQRILDALAA